MWTADDRRSGRAAETAASRCLDRRFFFFFHSGFSCAALPLGVSEGRLGIIIQYSRGQARLTHIRQVQSAPIDTWTCDFSFSVLVGNRWGAADTLARAQLWLRSSTLLRRQLKVWVRSITALQQWGLFSVISTFEGSEISPRRLAPFLQVQPSCSAGLKQCVLFLATSRGLFNVNDLTDSACDTPLTHWTLLTSVRAGETLAGVDIMMNCTPLLGGVWLWENKNSQMLMSCGRFQGLLN